MAAYLTHHLLSPTAARHLSITHFDRDGRHMKTTIIPPLPPSPTIASITTNSNSTTTTAPPPGNSNATFSPATLAHFLHAFHTAYNSQLSSSNSANPAKVNSNTSSNPSLDSSGSNTNSANSIPGTEESQRANQSGAHPNFDLAESKTGYTIYGSLPGLNRESVSVETDDLLFTITISGVIPRPVPGPVRGPIPGEEEEEDGEQDEEQEKEEEKQGSKHKDKHECYEAGNEIEKKKNGEKKGQEMLHWHVEERRVGPFCRVFHLPVGQEDMACVQASMRDGLLTVTVPKTVAEIYREEVSRRRKVEVGSGEGK